MMLSSNMNVLPGSTKGMWVKQVLWLAATLTVAAAPMRAQKTPNFTGAWEMESAKSLQRPQSEIQHLRIVVEHQEPKLSVKVTEKHAPPTGERNYVLQLTTDGSEVSSSIGQGTVPQSSRTSWDGAELVTTWNQAKESIPMSGLQRGRGLPKTETWTLAEDGNTLTITGSARRGDGQPSTWKYVMVRKSE